MSGEIGVARRMRVLVRDPDRTTKMKPAPSVRYR